MSADSRETDLQHRVAHLFANDQQFAAAQPDDAVSAAINTPGLRLPQLLEAAMHGYAKRPALGQRAVEYFTDSRTGRASIRRLPWFETLSYGELWDRVSAVTTTLTHRSSASVRPGDRVCMLGFTSVDYTTIDLALMLIGAVAVPLHTGAPTAQLRPIAEETEPAIVAASIDYLTEASELIEAYPPALLLVFDYRPEVDDQRDALDAVRARAAGVGSTVIIETLGEVITRAGELPPAPVTASDEDDPLSMILYTSGSTGDPKGAMYPESLMSDSWRGAPRSRLPSIILSFMPMSHMMGRGTIYMTLAQGGTCFFAAESDLSTFLEDLALVRPTQLNFVPRIWEMLFQEFQSRLARRVSGGADRAVADAQVKSELRLDLLGGRFVRALTASAPISPELRTWVESLLQIPLTEAYGATEVRGVTVNGRVQRPPVIDYKLVDVPELGYFGTDRPHPRGELCVKSADAFAGYYKRPELTAEVFDADGWYHTGDIMAELGPDRLRYVDRRNNVFKLSQGEFVTASKLETVFGTSPLVRQIYLYANSARPYPLAVVVPTKEALAKHDVESLKSLIGESLQQAARAAELQPYEIPRDFIVETTAFSLENGLLTGVRKLAWPKLKERYGPALEQLYADLAEARETELAELRRHGADRPTLDTLARAAAALLGVVASNVQPDWHFTDLGGDSLSALTFANLLHDIYGVDVQVGAIVSPANDLEALAAYVDTLRRRGSARPTFASVHGWGVNQVHARDLTLEKFIDEATLAAAPSLPGPAPEVRTVLLTGATGFLGRYLALEWLKRMDVVGGKLICLVRGKDAAAARARLDKKFDSGDPELLRQYHELAAGHLEVLAGDKGEADLGLDQQTWRRLAATVDLIVDPAALVNHMLPYSQLFGPNVVGTAELIRIALTAKVKPFIYVSTAAVGMQIEPSEFTEDADIRLISRTRRIDDTYANGYASSKWAGEVLLREAHDRFGLPVAVFRSNMILAEPTYAGQLNVSDMFTRMMLSLLATGLAPKSFYQLDGEGNRQRAHYDGLPVDFIAEAVTALGERTVSEFNTYHVMNPHDDGVGLDEYVDWLIDAGHPIQRVADYGDWLQRFETGLRGLPEHRRHNSLLPLMLAFREPVAPVRGSLAPTDRFRSAVRAAKIGADKDIPQITPPLIIKYVTDLRMVGLL